MQVRLTERVRNRIAKAVLEHRFAKAFADLTKDRAALAKAVYEDVLSKKHRDLIATLPGGWLPTDYSIQAQFGSTYDQINFAGDDYGTWIGERPERVYLPIPSSIKSGCAKAYEATHKLAIWHGESERALIDLRAKVASAGKEVEAALGSVTTITALVKAWPEIEPFCRDIAPAAIPLPAIPVATLNATFGLPVAEAA